MPRMARLVLPHIPHHVIHRGHNRQVVFAEDSDFLYYLSNLGELKNEYECRIHAYCLMPNHVHLIVNPDGDKERLAKLMQRTAARQTRYSNKKRNRSGTLWEGRYKSSPIQTEEYLLTCCRYIELNPVRAKIADTTDTYMWSSCPERMGITDGTLLDYDSCFQSLGETECERRKAYAALLREQLQEKDLQRIRQGINKERLTASRKFIEKCSADIGRYVGPSGPGRPRKN